MTLVRRTQPTWLPSVFDDLFDIDNWNTLNRRAFNTPAVNVAENDNEYRVEIAAPGMSKDDFKIRINEDNHLVVSVEKKQENTQEHKDEKYLRREFYYTQFEQALMLPDDVKEDAISAKIENGVLTIELPKEVKAVEEPKERVIEIR